MSECKGKPGPVQLAYALLDRRKNPVKNVPFKCQLIVFHFKNNSLLLPRDNG